MLMTNGLGATIGTLCAGSVVKHFCTWQDVDGSSYLLGDWTTTWLIFSGFALVVAVAFALIFKDGTTPDAEREVKTIESAPEGFVENA